MWYGSVSHGYKNGGLQSKLMEVANATNEEIAGLHPKLLSNKMPQHEQVLSNVQSMVSTTCVRKSIKGSDNFGDVTPQNFFPHRIFL